MGIPNAFGALGHLVESVPRDKEGPVLDRLSRFNDCTLSILYICPEFHNPMGTDLGPEGRHNFSDGRQSRMWRSSPMRYFTTSGLRDRFTKVFSQNQEITELLL